MTPELSRAQGGGVSSCELEKALKMDSKPFLIDVMLNSSNFTQAFVDSGCLCYSAFSETLVRELNLPRISIPPRSLKLTEENTSNNSIAYITWAHIDIDGHKEKNLWLCNKETRIPSNFRGSLDAAQ